MSDKAEMAITIYEILAPLIVLGLGWLGVKASQLIQAKIQNETLGRMMARLNDSVFTAVKAINQTLKAEIKRVKEPLSPGGVKITEDEAKQLKQACWDEIKSYWGAKGLKELGEVLGFGGDSSALARFIDGKIEATVSDLKRDPVGPQEPMG